MYCAVCTANSVARTVWDALTLCILGQPSENTFIVCDSYSSSVDLQNIVNEVKLQRLNYLTSLQIHDLVLRVLLLPYERKVHVPLRIQNYLPPTKLLFRVKMCVKPQKYPAEIP